METKIIIKLFLISASDVPTERSSALGVQKSEKSQLTAAIGGGLMGFAVSKTAINQFL